jgi:hypothetical protein
MGWLDILLSIVFILSCYKYAGSAGTVVKLPPHHPKVEGLSSATVCCHQKNMKKWLAVTYTLAYYNMELIIAVKRFISGLAGCSFMSCFHSMLSSPSRQQRHSGKPAKNHPKV